MANSRKLIVEIVGDDRALSRTLGSSSHKLGRFQRDVEGVTVAQGKLGKLTALKGLGAGIIASEATRQLLAFTTAGSDLNEQISKSQVVFGSSAQAIDRWSRTTAEGFGISRTAALEAAGTFGTITRSMGLPEAAAADLSRNLVNLAGDLASFNNVRSDEALLALRSAIVGEYEPLRRLGSALSEARVQQQAMAETGKTNARELTNQEKVTARYNLILKDTVLAQGDAARTSESFANKQRELAAKVADLKTNIGTLLIPAVSSLADSLIDATDAAGGLLSALRDIANFKMPNSGDLSKIVPQGLKPPEDGKVKTGNPLYDFIANAVVGRFADQDKQVLRPDAKGPGKGIGDFLATAGPGRGIGEFIAKQAAAVAAEPKEKERRPGRALVNIPTGFQNEILKALNANDRSALTKALIKTRQFEERQLERALKQGDTEAVNQIRGNIESLQNQIAGVYAEISADSRRIKDATEDAAKRTKERNGAKAKEAAENLRRAADERGDKAAAAIADLTDTMANAIGSAADAISDMAKKVEQRTKDFRSAILDELERSQEQADVGREVRDAKENLRLALQSGGKIGIRNAREDLADALRSQAAFVVEGAQITQGPRGGFKVQTEGAINFTISGVQDPERVAELVIAKLGRKAKRTAPTFQGRLPGVSPATARNG